MMKQALALSALAAALMLPLCGCESLQEIENGSQNAVIEDANAHVSKAQSPKSTAKSGANTSELKVEQAATSSAPESTDTAETAFGTVSAAATQTASAGEGQTIPTGLLPPVDETTAQEIAVLPDYATASGRQTCPTELDAKARETASELAATLLGKLKSDSGAMYAAPTVIPDEFADCIKDVREQVAAAIASSGRFTVAKGEGISVAQNAGSSSLIPRFVRECRRLDIPYLAVSVVRKVGGNAALTVRIIRVVSGVTLTQAYKKLN